MCQAATWSGPQLRYLGRLLCREVKTKSAHVLLAPTICCARNPLGGRNFECFGEDPFLTGSLAVEYVAGVQEDGKVAATPKHFVANEQEHERFSIDAQIPEQALREIYLKPFEMVIRASCPPECLMTAYNSVNGNHADMDTRVMEDILRRQWGFQGLVMSGWGGTNSTLESILAGTDLEMPVPPEQRGQKLLEAVSTDKQDTEKALSAIQKSSARILQLAGKHGLLGLTPEAACRRCDAPSRRRLTGKKYLEAGKSYLVCVEACARKEPWPDQSEGYDRKSMALPGGQDDLVNALLRKVQRPDRLILVTQSGSPVDLPWIDRAFTFVQAWYGGQEAGNALEDILLGTVNPSGKLPITWPKAYFDLPFAHDPESWPGVNGTVKYKKYYQVGYRWYSHQTQTQPQWWFGYGQSYTNFQQNIMSISCPDSGCWMVDVSVVNTGNRDGAEVVQLYKWPAADKHEVMLVCFDKTPVMRPQESLRLTVKVNKQDAARWVEDRWVIAPGKYVFGLGIEAEESDGNTWKLYQSMIEWPAATGL
ncbi:glycoside hydrolase family 3 protein, partial [Colletotrichum incanum]